MGMTAVSLESAQAIVVQAWISPTRCDRGPDVRSLAVKLCTDTDSALTDLVLRMR
jgi:hypothetical protein